MTKKPNKVKPVSRAEEIRSSFADITTPNAINFRFEDDDEYENSNYGVVSLKKEGKSTNNLYARFNFLFACCFQLKSSGT